MGNNEIDEDVMPVFLINGFLEAGKTQFLEFTMDQEYFQTEGKTLLIVCEEGDTEYDEKKLKKHQTAVVASDPDLEKLPLFKQLQTEVYGDVPIEFGYCNGRNNKLNAVEYHRCSEIDIAATDLILMLGLQQDINYDNNTYETSKIEQFFIPAGTAVELYATTLHFAPSRQNNEEFRCGIVLIKDTNLPKAVNPCILGTL